MTTLEIIALIFWIVIFIASILVEVFTEELVSIWFSISSVICIFLDIFKVDIPWQVLFFVLFSTALFIFSRKVIKKVEKNTNIATNLDRSIGQFAKALESFKSGEKGEVEVNFQRWVAISKQDINKDEKVVVVGIEGNKLIVEKNEDVDIK